MKVFETGKCRFFDGLVGCIAVLTSLGAGLVLASGRPMRAYDPVEQFRIHSTVACNITLLFQPRDLLRALAEGGWPARLVFQEERLMAQDPAQDELSLNSVRFKAATAVILQAMFVHYFESYRDPVEANFGSDVGKWPQAWNFGRVVRNAFAHGGAIHFAKLTAPSVTWRWLTYGPADNGRQIVHQDIGLVEAILLMEEMDSHL